MTVQIEKHATVNMVKQRIGIIVAAHPKHQTLSTSSGVALEDVAKLQDCLADGATLLLDVAQPAEPEAPPVVLSDDEGLVSSAQDCEPLPQEGAELTDEEQDAQNALKQDAAELLEDGDRPGALAKLTAAILLGAPTAMLLCKRADLLLKQKRTHAAAADAAAALAVNPDSAKAYRIRGQARRYCGDYAGAAADFAKSQAADYDESVADMHAYCQKRAAKLALKAEQGKAEAV